MKRLLLVSLFLAGCGNADSVDGAYPYDERKATCLADEDCGQGEVCFAGQCIFQGEAPADADGLVDDLPEEQEQRLAAFTVPAATGQHVWVASPATDTLARIHGTTLSIDAIEVGDEPSVVRAGAPDDAVLVLNRGSDELALVRGSDDVEFHRLPGHFNALTLDPSGAHALCWFDLSQVRTGEDVASLQDVAVVELATGVVRSVTIGFRPRRITFTADGTTALVVTDDGLSVFRPAELSATNLAATIPLATGVFGQAGREVAVTPDGAYAVSRGPDEAGVTVVDLADGIPRFVALGAQPSDLDLLPDGRTALVMLRAAERLALVPLDTVAEDPDSVRYIDFSGHVLGSAAVAPAGEFAVLYTTVQSDDVPPQVALLELTGEVIVHRPLRKGIAGVEVAPDGQTAFVLHTKEEGEPDPVDGEEQFLARSYGYSLLDLRTLNAKLQTTAAAPSGLVFAPDRGEAYLVLRSANTAAVQRVNLASLAVETWALGRPPEVVGVLASVDRAFVTQTHPEGRISFINLADQVDDGGRLETVSGYALNGRIQ